MQPGDPPELLAQAMHIKLVVVAAPDGGVVSPSVDVHCMGQGMIAASSLHHLHRSAEMRRSTGAACAQGVWSDSCPSCTIFLL
jgi:hypothetical protein